MAGRPLHPQSANRRARGASRRRSFGSLVTIVSRCWLAQMTTCASAMSRVRLAARRMPTCVALAASSAAINVFGWRSSRDNRTCAAGRRSACASAVAGIVTRAPSSAARASSATTRRSFRSSAISAPASSVTPFKRLDSGPSAAHPRVIASPPKRAPSGSAGHLSVAARDQALRPSLRHPRGKRRPRASQSLRRYRLSPRQPACESLRAARPRG